jgi:ferredoxin
MTHVVTRLGVNPIACTGHGACAELLPELITLDEWGYPVIADGGVVPARLARTVRRAVTNCPTLALWLARRGNSEQAQISASAAGGKLGT